jgi:AAA15 family ATPase/GTPase
MIEELVLENFRGFRSLGVQGLKPVNLIVGHNNTGKTSLLEGIFL